MKLNELPNDSLGYVVGSLLIKNGLDKNNYFFLPDVINYLYTGEWKLVNTIISTSNLMERNITISKCNEDNELCTDEPYKLKFSIGNEHSHDNHYYQLVLYADSIINLYFKAFIALFLGLDCLNNPIINVPEFLTSK